MLQKKSDMVRSVDLARHMGFSKPSISHAVGVLRNGGFLTVDEDGFLHLTDIGREVAEKIYERHQFFTERLVAAGVDQETVEQDDCRIEHAISDKSLLIILQSAARRQKKKSRRIKAHSRNGKELTIMFEIRWNTQQRRY
jgi:Mn-dependent DtxR family transcriptional regulator